MSHTLNALDQAAHDLQNILKQSEDPYNVEDLAVVDDNGDVFYIDPSSVDNETREAICGWTNLI